MNKIKLKDCDKIWLDKDTCIWLNVEILEAIRKSTNIYDDDCKNVDGKRLDFFSMSEGSKTTDNYILINAKDLIKH